MASIFFSVACSNEENSHSISSEKLAMIERAKEFGHMHNIHVADALSNLNSTPSRAGSRSFADIRAQVYNFLTTKTSRGDDLPPMPGGGGFGDGGDSTFIDGGKTIPSIRDEMDDLELDIIDRALLALKKDQLNLEIDNLLIETAESDLPDLHKEAVMNFLTTLQNSDQYWLDYGQDWVAYLRANLSEEDQEIFHLNEPKIAWMNVVLADAYWGWKSYTQNKSLGTAACKAAIKSIIALLNELSNEEAPMDPQ